MTWEKVVASVGNNGVIFSIEDGGYAVVYPKNREVFLSQYWLSTARYDPVGHPGLIDDDVLERAKMVIDDFDQSEYDEFRSGIEEYMNSDVYQEMEENQKEFIAESKKRDRHLYL